MKDLNYYLDVFEDSDAISLEMLAKAIYAGLKGDAENALPEEIALIARRLPDREHWPTREARQIGGQYLLRRAVELYDAADVVRAARKMIGMNQTELGKVLGVTQSYMSQIESGERGLGNRGRRSLKRFADKLPASVDRGNRDLKPGEVVSYFEKESQMEDSETEKPYPDTYESKCPGCGTKNVTDARTFGDDFPRNKCLECGKEYSWTDRNDVETREP